MKIETKKLTSFLKKAKLSGPQMISECILDFAEDGIKINANDPAKQARTMSWLKSTAFESYEAIGKVGVNDLDTFTKVLERFGTSVTLKKEGNVMGISSKGKNVDVELISETFLETDTGEPTLEFDDTFEISASRLGDILNDVKLNKDAVLEIKTGEKKVLFSNTGKYKFRNEIEAKQCKGGVTVKFGDPFINCVANLDGNLTFSVKTDYPAKIMEKTEDSIITLIIAPRVENND